MQTINLYYKYDQHVTFNNVYLIVLSECSGHKKQC